MLKNELKRFEGMLCPDTPEYSEEEVDEEDEDYGEVRQGALKIALHILRKMDRTNMASVLESSEKVIFILSRVSQDILLIHTHKY